MKRKPLIILNLFWAVLAAAAFFAGSTVTKSRISHGDASDAGEDVRPRRSLPPRPSGSARIDSGEGAGSGSRSAQRTTNPAGDFALQEKYFKRVVRLSKEEFATLAKADFEEAIRVLDLMEDKVPGFPPSRGDFENLIVTELINRDLDAAISFAAEKSCSGVTHLLALAIYEERGIDALLEWTDGIESVGRADNRDGRFPYKETGSCEALQIVAREEPDRARQWVVANAGKPYVVANTLYRAAWQVDSNDALRFKWLTELPITGEKRTEAIGLLFRDFMLRDFEAAQEWISGQELQPMHDRAIHEFALKAGRFDFEAAGSWAGRISDEELRRSTIFSLEYAPSPATDPSASGDPFASGTAE